MRLKKLLQESFGLKDEEYTDEQSILGLEEFDSMNHMLFITQLEEEFSIELTGDEIASMITVKDIKEVLKEKGAFTN